MVMFYLTKNDIVQSNAEMHFDYTIVEKFVIKNWYLTLFFKDQIAYKRHFCQKNELKVFLIGTVLYNTQGNPLESILIDFWNNKLDLNSLKGNYCLIFWNDEDIYIVLDKLGVQQVFYNEKTQGYSSSFLFLLRNSPYKFSINKEAFQEKLATGFILGSDTLISEIRRVLPRESSNYNDNNLKWMAHEYIPVKLLSFHNEGRKKSIDSQINVLSSYFQLVENNFYGCTGDLGLSGGFDCRLILALSEKYLSKKLHLHSHNTINVHEEQIKIANELARHYGTALDLVPTLNLEKYNDDDLEKILQDSFLFFDGITARHLGAFSETYTSTYKRKSMNNADFSLNGLGGEIFRDSYFTGKRMMNWKQWINRYIFMPFSQEAVGNSKTLKITEDYIRYKLESLLDLNYDKMDIFSTHAYYGLIKMPQCNGAVSSAYNKVSPFLFPFIEYDNTIEALKAIPYFGIGGQYQAALISEISPKLAQVRSNYGFSFDKVNVKYLVWSKLKSIGSIDKRNKMVVKKLLKKENSISHINTVNYISNSKLLSEAKEILMSLSPMTNYNIVLLENTQKRYILQLSYTLKELLKYTR